MDFSYKNNFELSPNYDDNFNLDSSFDARNENLIENILIHLTEEILKKSVNDVVIFLKKLGKLSESEFTLKVVKHFQLFEKLIYLSKFTNQEIQDSSVNVFPNALNNETIQYSMNFNIIYFLIQLINLNKQNVGFAAIQSLSKIASFNIHCQHLVIFHLSSLNVLREGPEPKHHRKQRIRPNKALRSIVEDTDKDGAKKYIPWDSYGIDPEGNNNNDYLDSKKDNEYQNVQSFQKLIRFILFTEKGETKICIPSINLINSLLKYELNQYIISFCFDTLISLLFICDQDTLSIILNALCLITQQEKKLWKETFQKSSPSKWISQLFQSENVNSSFKNLKLLMKFLHNVIYQNEVIYGMPFNLLIQKLQYVDDNYIIASLSASSIDLLLKNNSKLIQNFIDLGLLQITTSIYPNLSFRAKSLIISYLTRIAQYGLRAHKILLIQNKFISFFTDVLIDLNPESFILRILLALNEIFRCAKHENMLDSCKEQIKDNLDFIIDFTNHENPSISHTAKEFVNDFLEPKDENDDDDTQVFNF